MAAEYMHIGIPVLNKKPNMVYNEWGGFWVNESVDAYDYKIEYLKFEEGTRFPEILSKQPHVAYKVNNMDPYLKEAQQVIFGPETLSDTVRLAFITLDDAIIELYDKTHQKMQISHAAANLIGDSRTIFIDASTTASYIAGDIQTSEKLMVVTNSLRVAEELADGAPEVWCTGGRLLRTSLAFVGNQSIRCVSDFCVDIAFFSSSALGADGVIQDYSPEETEIRRTVLRSAAKKVFLCDSSKFGQTSPFRVCAITEVDCIITDAPLPEGIGATTAFTRTETNGVYLYQRIGNDPNAPKT